MGEPAPRSALIIDDSEEFCQLLARQLAKAYPGIEIELYDPRSRGRPAGDFQWSRFDLLVLDYELGGGENGLDWLRCYHDHPHFPPAIVMTAHGDEELAVKAIKSGAQYYFNKRTLNAERLGQAVVDVLVEREAQRQEAELTALHEAIFDKETFYRSLQEVTGGESVSEGIALVLVSLDRLEHLQQVLGLIEFDALVAHLCELTGKVLNAGDFKANVTRVGDGTIAALVRNAAGREASIGSSLCDAIAAHPYDHQGAAVERHVSIGILPLEAQAHDQPSNVLLAQADVAARMARQSEGNSYFVRRPEVVTAPAADKQAALDMRAAIAEDRLQPRFQRLASVSDVSSALNAAIYQSRVRVVTEQGDPPAISALLVDPLSRRMLDRWMVRDTMQRLLTMADKGKPCGGILMRLSEDSLVDAQFEPWVAALIKHVKHPAAHSGIVFEVRAEDILSLGAQGVSAMQALRERHGMKFALDGVSSASILRSCARLSPYSFVTFVPPREKATSKTQQHVEQLGGVVALAHELGALVIAQRVETAEQLTMAIQLNVDFVLGYFIADPQGDMTGVDIVESLEFDGTGGE